MKSPQVIAACSTPIRGRRRPVTDSWGTWVSALIPMSDPQTGAVLAVLGMDIDAAPGNGTWPLDQHHHL